MSDTVYTSLTTAAFTAALGLFLKIYFDHRARVDKARGIAAGLRGEITAYHELLNPDTLLLNLQIIAAWPDKGKLPGLLSDVPEGHPVFDSVAKDIGLLTPKLAVEISKFYNIISGMRLMHRHLKTPGFLALAPDEQTSYINVFVDRLKLQIPRWPIILDHLHEFEKSDTWFDFFTAKMASNYIRKPRSNNPT
jgi:hypothetical protein